MIGLSSLRAAPTMPILSIILVHLVSIASLFTSLTSSTQLRSSSNSPLQAMNNNGKLLNLTSDTATEQHLMMQIATNSSKLANSNEVGLPHLRPQIDESISMQSNGDESVGSVLESPATQTSSEMGQSVPLDEISKSAVGNQYLAHVSNIEDELVNQIVRKVATSPQQFDELEEAEGQLNKSNIGDKEYDLQPTIVTNNLSPEATNSSADQEILNSPEFISPSDDQKFQYDEQHHEPLENNLSADRPPKLVAETWPTESDATQRKHSLGVIVRPQRHSDPPTLQEQSNMPPGTDHGTDAAKDNHLAPYIANITMESPAVSQNQAAHNRETGLATGVGQSRTGSIQARSMHSTSSSSALKMVQHTKPPYETYNPFSQRSSVAANQVGETQQQPQQSDHRLASRNIFPPMKSGQHDNNRDLATNGNAAGSRTNSSHDNVALMNSFDRISSQLSPEEPAIGGAKVPSGGGDKAQLQKLTSVNQITELSPIELANNNLAISDSGSPTGNLDQDGSWADNFNRHAIAFYPQPQRTEQADSSGGSPMRTSHHNDRYGNYSNPADQVESLAMYMDRSALTSQNQERVSDEIIQNKLELGNSRQSNQFHATGDDWRMTATDGTSHAKLQQSAPKNDTDKQQAMDFMKIFKERTGPHPHRPMENNKQHYAASFINVTGPMVEPLSATEAMELAEANQLGSKGSLHHQVSGFLRSTPSPAGLAVDLAADRWTQQPQRAQTLYYMPSQQQQPIYSQPANHFSPPPSQLDDLRPQNSSSAEERTRLDRTEMMMASGGRSKPQISWMSASTVQPPNNASGTTTLHQASGFRSPTPYYSSGIQNLVGPPSIWPATKLPSVGNYLAGSLLGLSAGERTNSTATASPSASSMAAPTTTNETSSVQQQQAAPSSSTRSPLSAAAGPQVSGSTTNGFITGGGALNLSQMGPSSVGAGEQASSNAIVAPSNGAGGGSNPAGLNRRVFNLTRVEHISAECSNDLIRTAIIFNGTFKGIIYSSGYVRDPNCMYINGTGKTRYDFSIRLNQCGTLGRQELHPSRGPNEVRRRDQVMWNTLSIQYNPIVEQEWDEHFRVSCEYGSDFWKTVSFSPFNVETNTGSPVVFTVDPPQCQMEILRGHGMVGPRQEVVSGPVTVGDPLTLLIHMKSEKAGYDILVKNCIAHNGGHQKMQLIDPNGCVVNERFISPFRGTYNGNDMKHVTLYSYLKAFRFTGSPVLYLECEIHMCQSACPPQMCYWRRLSKRSALNGTHTNRQPLGYDDDDSDEDFSQTSIDQDQLASQASDNSSLFVTTTLNYHQLGQEQAPIRATGNRSARKMRNSDLNSDDDNDDDHEEDNDSNGPKKSLNSAKDKMQRAKLGKQQQANQISDKVSLFQALEVRQEREPGALYSQAAYPSYDGLPNLSETGSTESLMKTAHASSLTCYRRAELLAFLFTGVSVLLVAIGISIGCCWRAAALRQKAGKQKQVQQQQQQQRNSLANIVPLSTSANHLSSGPLSAGAYSSASSGSFSGSIASEARSSSQCLTNHLHHHDHRNYQNNLTSNGIAGSNHLINTSEYHKTLRSLAPILNHQSARHKNRIL